MAVDPAAPSLKALGKRRLDDAVAVSPDSSTPPLAKKPRPQPSQVQQVQKQERRVTRSSLGGLANGSREGSFVGSEGTSQPVYLPSKTSILLTTRPLPKLTRHPPINRSPPTPSTSAAAATADTTAGQPPVSEAVTDDTPRQKQEGDVVEKPLFRLLDETELLPPRGTRHAPAPEVDTSDAFYLRLHRYPEVLEKRASRLERERLIHERSKLINELEELRGRAWVYAGTSAGGRAEEERQRKIKEMEERLARYDALLPNQPRKSNFLNLASTAAGPAPHPHAHPSRGDSRTESPAPRAAGARTRQARPADLSFRPPTPVSASASQNGSRTTIRIKFGPPSRTTSPSHSTCGSEAGLDLDRYTVRGETRKGPKRDRKAERERAEMRRKMGLKPRASIDKARGGEGEGRKARRSGRATARRQSYAEDEDDEDDEGTDADAEGEDWGEEFWGGGEATRNHSGKPAELVRLRLPDSFFHSAALRDSVISSQGPNARRSSSRVAYAFGQRLPDHALLRQVEFELHGGISGDAEDDEEGHSRMSLEQLVSMRMQTHGEEVVVLDGRVLPKSAVDAWSKDPLLVSPVKQAPSVLSDAGSNATSGSFAAPALRRNGSRFFDSPSVSRAVSPELQAPTAAPPPLPLAFALPQAFRGDQG
ncbi:proteophosphoglycan 5 [Rhodotorula toruloides]|uniref:Proteophosphoglycan 5 n=1 Tax=Rhodotorula toruloides TaxID=5286 RepID=A0A511KCB3_RHOTO|nr:proteophosphoglycan 5 [Rhodotorula toruloides]